MILIKSFLMSHHPSHTSMMNHSIGYHSYHKKNNSYRYDISKTSSDCLTFTVDVVFLSMLLANYLITTLLGTIEIIYF